MKSMSRSVLAALVTVLALSALTAASASAHQWKVNGVEASGQEVNISGGVTIVRWSTAEIECTAVTGKGTVKATGTGEAAEIKFTGCRFLGKPQCNVHTEGAPHGTVVATNLPTRLVERETMLGTKVLADELKEAANKELIWYRFEPETPEGCVGVKELKTKGQMAAAVKNLASGSVEINFPTPQLKGNTWNAGGMIMSLYGPLSASLVGGGTLTAS